MNEGLDEHSKPPRGNSDSVDIMNQDHDRPLDWNNTAAVWTTPLQDLPPPPINPQLLGLPATIHDQIGNLSIVDLPPVYPYIPSPSITLLDQSEPRRKAESSDQNLQISSSRELDVGPPSSTPPRFEGFMSELTGHNYSPWSAKSRISTDNASSSPVSAKEEDVKRVEKEEQVPASATEQEPASAIEQEHTSTTENEDATCSTIYVRGINGGSNDGYGSCQHLLHGQIWHGRVNKTSRRWRRHQWVLERSQVVVRNEEDQTATS